MKYKKSVKFFAILTAIGCLISFGAVGAGAAVIEDNDVSAVEIQQPVSAEDTSALPSKYSSLDLGYVTDVLTQTYNDCWGFAGLATYESKLLRDGISVTNMSTDALNLWATPRQNKTGWQRKITDAGYYEITTGYLTSWQGGIESSVIGEVDLSGSAKPEDLPKDLTRYGVTEIKLLDNTNKDEIKAAIMEDGGVYAAFAYSASCVSSSKRSFFMPSNYSGSSIGHAIEIVGWNDSYSKSNFKAVGGVSPSDNGAWLCKGSWGSDYNDFGGYFWISYEDGMLLGDLYNTCYSIGAYREITDNVRLEQNEIFGATYNFNYVDRDSVTYIGKFDFSNGFNSLDGVVFETSSVGAEYNVYYIPVDNLSKKLNTDKSSWTKLCSSTVEHNGYICADTSDFDLPLGYGAIGVEIDTSEVNKGKISGESGYIYNTLGVSEWLQNSTKMVFVNDSKRGDCYISYDSNTYELLDWYSENNNDDMGGTFAIKAITEGEGAKVSLLGDADLSGNVNIKDATLVQQYAVEMYSPTAVRKLNADVDGNGAVNVSDATQIQIMIVNS